MLRIVQKLKHEDLFAIANEEILAVQVKNFIPSDLAQQLTQKILGAGYAYYENASTVGRIGMAFYETNHQPEKVAKYFSVAQENIDEFRSRCFPLISPIDLVRCTVCRHNWHVMYM